MKQETFDRNIKLISSKDLNDSIYCFQTLLSSCNLILFEPLIFGIILDERKHDSSLIVQKAMLHAYSIEKITKGLEIYNPINKRNICIGDPFSIVVLCRSLLESYLTFNHINSSHNEAENLIRFKIWIQYGLRYRTKTEKSINFKKEKHNQTLLDDKENIVRLTEEIKESEFYMKISDDKKLSFLNTIKREWKISFTENSYKTLGWQDLLENTGMKATLSSEVYNFYSWYAHTTCVSIYQLREMYKDGFINKLIINTIEYVSFFLSMAISEIIKLDDCYQKAYIKLNQEVKDIINAYNYVIRGDDFTIEKIE